MRIIAKTPRFTIRNFKPEEEDIFLALFDDEAVTVHLPKRTKEEHLKLFRESLTEYDDGKATGRWGMFNNEDGDFMGMCLLRPFDGDTRKIELGYVLRQEYWAKGIATEMANMMIAYGFLHTGAGEIVAVTTPGNIISQKVLEKAGLTRAGNYTRVGVELPYFKIDRPVVAKN
jgi:ribosomal-protein-alanine N-acetyltransferase